MIDELCSFPALFISFDLLFLLILKKMLNVSLRLNKHSNHRNTDETLNIKLNTFAENSAVTVVERKPMRDNAVYKSC